MMYLPGSFQSHFNRSHLHRVAQDPADDRAAISNPCLPMTSHCGREREGLQGSTHAWVPPCGRSCTALCSFTLFCGNRDPADSRSVQPNPGQCRWTRDGRTAATVTVFGRRQRQLDDMEDTKTHNGQRTPEEDFSEFGEVRVISRPAPDAEDRLRRLFTLLLRPSAGDGKAESKKDAPPDDQHFSDHVEAEA